MNPYTQGYICAKVRRFPELLYGEGRLLHPAVRRGATGAEELERFARLYAESSPAVLRTVWGFERNRNGGSAVAAALALPAVAGKFGVRGGGFTMNNAAGWGIDHEAATCEPEPATRLLNINRLGEHLLERQDPPVSVLFVYNCNPVATVPNQEKVLRVALTPSPGGWVCDGRGGRGVRSYTGSAMNR